jgi:hypothetical protein
VVNFILSQLSVYRFQYQGKKNGRLSQAALCLRRTDVKNPPEGAGYLPGHSADSRSAALSGVKFFF